MKKPSSQRLCCVLLFALPLMLAACSGTSHVRLPAEPDQWQAIPAGCTSVSGGNEIILKPDPSTGIGRIAAEDFRWSGSAMEFRIYDDPDAVFNITLYDDIFAEVRRKNARMWYDESGKRLDEAGKLWRLDRVHALGVSGDDELIKQGLRAFGGSLTVRMGPRGLPERTAMEVLSESFKANQWNDIRLEMREGMLTVWVNGERGESVQTDPRLNGTFGFEVWKGELRISDIKLTKL